MTSLQEREAAPPRQSGGFLAGLLVGLVAGVLGALAFASTPVSADTNNGDQPTIITITPQPQNGGNVGTQNRPRPACPTANAYVDTYVEQPDSCLD